MRRIFHDDSLEETLREKGYVKIQLLSHDEVHQLKEIHARYHDSNMQGFHTTLLHESAATRRTISDAIMAIAEKRVQKYLINYQALVGNFVVKEPGEDSLLPVHQDWSVVSEPEFTALNIWCGLQDITVENGAIRMYPGSQLLRRSPRSPSVPNPYREAFSQIDSELVTETVEAGEALIFEGSLIHASYPNQSAERRLATALIMIPDEAQPWHFYFNEETGNIEKFAIDRDFFDTFNIGQRPEPYPVAEEIPCPKTTYNLRDIHRMTQSETSFFRRLAALFSRNSS